MYMVTVLFEVKPECVPGFRTAVLAQAQNSLTNEPGCTRFDVCFDPRQSNRVFLYEAYSDAQAFAAHLQAPHFLSFDDSVRNCIVNKQVDAWELANPS